MIKVVATVRGVFVPPPPLVTTIPNPLNCNCTVCKSVNAQELQNKHSHGVSRCSSVETTGNNQSSKVHFMCTICRHRNSTHSHREKVENTVVNLPCLTMCYHSVQHRTNMVFSNTSLLLYVVVKITTNYNIRVMYHEKTL